MFTFVFYIFSIFFDHYEKIFKNGENLIENKFIENEETSESQLKIEKIEDKSEEANEFYSVNVESENVKKDERIHFVDKMDKEIENIVAVIIEQNNQMPNRTSDSPFEENAIVGSQNNDENQKFNNVASPSEISTKGEISRNIIEKDFEKKLCLNKTNEDKISCDPILSSVASVRLLKPGENETKEAELSSNNNSAAVKACINQSIFEVDDDSMSQQIINRIEINLENSVDTNNQNKESIIDSNINITKEHDNDNIYEIQNNKPAENRLIEETNVSNSIKNFKTEVKPNESFALNHINEIAIEDSVSFIETLDSKLGEKAIELEEIETLNIIDVVQFNSKDLKINFPLVENLYNVNNNDSLLNDRVILNSVANQVNDNNNNPEIPHGTSNCFQKENENKTAPIDDNEIISSEEVVFVSNDDLRQILSNDKKPESSAYDYRSLRPSISIID